MSSSTLRRLLNSSDPPTPTVWSLTPILWVTFFCLFLTFGLGDILSTLLAFNFSLGQEGNPFIALLLQHGVLPFLAAKLIAFLLIYLVARIVLLDGSRAGRLTITSLLLFASLFYALVSLSNLMATFLGLDLFHYLVR